MAKKKLIAVLILVLAGIGLVYFVVPNLSGRDITFNPENRYYWQRLDYMGVIYENQSDIYAFNEGYSESDNCPWGFVHNGIDYFFKNGSPVIAAAPGQVINIEWRDNGAGTENRFHVSIEIRFNATTVVSYNFEPWTQSIADKDRQLSLIEVEVGEWVSKGDKIATFLNINSGAHIHFGVRQNGEWQCPEQYFSPEAYAEIMSLIHSYHPDWELCYP